MKLLDLELSPVTRLTWNSLAAKEYWAPRVERVNSLYWRLERETVIRGLRDCNVWYLQPETFGRDQAEINRQGLQFIPIRTVQRYNGFGHRHVELPEGAPNSMVYGVVCRDPEAGREFAEAHHANPIDHRTIGRLLGYPSCCTDWFQREWAENRYIDPIWQQADNTLGADRLDEHTIHVRGDYRCNVILRFFGIRLCPLLPCSFTCEACAAFVQQWLDLAHELDAEGAQDLTSLLQMPVEWNALKGLGIIHTPLFRGHVNTVACYPRYAVRYESPAFDYATLPHAARGSGWPYELFMPNAILERS